MKRALSVKNGILIEETPMFPADFGKNQAQKDLKEFEKNLINAFNNDKVSDELIDELDAIESEMVNGKSIKVKDVEELAERYGV